MKKPKRKKQWLKLRFRKNDHSHNLICAAQRWIHANGGTAVVLGGIGLLNEGEGRYQVCVGALGKLPEKSKSK